jgi:cellulose biosynthesis protein BcsQ
MCAAAAKKTGGGNSPTVSIAFFNNKGGVGKTTLICNIGAVIALSLNKKVLIVDADPQCNATQYILAEQTVDAVYGVVPLGVEIERRLG